MNEAVKKAIGHAIRPKVRRWIYGVTIAALGVAVYARWIEAGALAVLVPLVLALLNVNDDGTPRETDMDTETEKETPL